MRRGITGRYAVTGGAGEQVRAFYLSLYLKQHREECYRLLDLVRAEGDWEGWLDFLLEGVRMTADLAVTTAQRLVALFAEDRARIQGGGGAPDPRCGSMTS